MGRPVGRELQGVDQRLTVGWYLIPEPPCNESNHYAHFQAFLQIASYETFQMIAIFIFVHIHLSIMNAIKTRDDDSEDDQPGDLLGKSSE